MPEAAKTAVEPAFHAPWQARLFALTVALVERGAFGWSDWSAALAAASAQEGDAPPLEAEPSVHADRHYRNWSRALAALLDTAGIARAAEIDACAAAWQDAAARTPHGQPIRLER